MTRSPLDDSQRCGCYNGVPHGGAPMMSAGQYTGVVTMLTATQVPAFAILPGLASLE